MKYKVKESVNFLPVGSVQDLPNDKFNDSLTKQLVEDGYLVKATSDDEKAYEAQRKAQLNMEERSRQNNPALSPQDAAALQKEAEKFVTGDTTPGKPTPKDPDAPGAKAAVGGTGAGDTPGSVEADMANKAKTDDEAASKEASAKAPVKHK